MAPASTDAPKQMMNLAGELHRADTLSLKARLAWATAVIERVVLRYSEHFLVAYRQRELIDAAWSAVNAKRTDEARFRALQNDLHSMADRLEAERYNYIVAQIWYDLLEVAASRRDKHEIRGAVESAGYLYAIRSVYANGLSDLITQQFPDDIDALQLPFYRFANNALEIALKSAQTPLTAQAFAGLALEPTREDLPDLRARVRAADISWPAAPAHEVGLPQ